MNKLFDPTLCSVLRIDDVSSYLDAVTCLLAENSWIYRYKNIDIFVHDVLDEIPDEWAEVLSELSTEELWEIPTGFKKDEWPESLKAFLSKCSELGSCRFSKSKYMDIRNLANFNYLKETSVKKLYEVHIISHLIKDVCNAMECNSVLDIGCGKGVLDQALHKNFGICCLGLDSSSQHISVAQKRIKSDSCQQSINYKTVEVTNSEECLSVLKTAVNDLRNLHCSCNSFDTVSNGKNSNSSIMVGLHSCGNFAQDMMKLFCRIDDLVAFVLVGCCYNKADLSDFPMSSSAKHAVDNARAISPSWSPCISGLRQAARLTRNYAQTCGSIKHLLHRCVLESYIAKEKIVWKNPKRYIRESDLIDFPTYCSNMFKGHELSGDEKTLNELNLFYQDKLKYSKKLQILLVLQYLIQPVWEAFITLDRVMFFRERNISVDVIELWDDLVSPRNLAVCAYKR